ncbi:memo1 family protein [Diplodia corticola]|uniref:Memo1 family protein n=1 Tax=Diplodia corticola TaxID=236234 RepID=A0A1J9QYD8_9PEZI|nr:memo1 family protein [Diplodia corticola]OJD33416.1 memo1 family protein [Diplodia corticola]
MAHAFDRQRRQLRFGTAFNTTTSIRLSSQHTSRDAARAAMQSLYRCCARGDPVGAGSTSPGGDAQAPAHQLQSPLFRLPAEIRLMVWEYALGDELIHMEHCSARKCYEPGHPAAPVSWAILYKEERLACGKTWAQKDWLKNMNWHFASTVCTKNADLPDGQTVRKGAILGLPLSCKRCYRESLAFLYMNNLFDFKTPQDFLCFSKTIPRPLTTPVTRIRIRLVLNWSLNYAHNYQTYRTLTKPPVWNLFCAAVWAMKLQEVHVNLRQAIPLGHIADVLLLLDRLRVDRVVIETYQSVDEIRSYIEQTGRKYHVRERVPWEECFVTFAS